MAAMMLLAVSCGDDDDFSGNGNNNGGGKQLAKLTWVYNEGGSQTYVEEVRFTYNGGQMSHAELWEDGSRYWYADFTYNGNKLNEITYHRNTQTLMARFTYSGNNPARADLYVNGSQESTVQFTCNNMGQITCANANYGDFVMNYEWNGNNVVREEVVGEGYYTYSYDNKINPVNNAFAMFMLLMEEDGYFMSANNLSHRSWTSYSGGSSSRSFSYEYTGDYPAKANYSSSGGSGTYHYYYTDGTGSNYTGGGSQQNYTVSVSANNSSYGYVTGGGTYPAGSTVTLTAYPYSGYQFSYWSDGSTQNPRTITVNGNVSYTAYFTSSGSSSGVHVSFGYDSWDAQYTDAVFYAGSNAFVLVAGETSSSDFPLLQLIHIWDNSPSTGSYSATSSVSTSEGVNLGNSYIWYYENEEDFVTINYTNGNSANAGDWWDKNMTLNITSLDLNSMTISFTATAVMGKVMDVLDGSTWASATSRNITITANNLYLGYDASKSIKKANSNMISRKR